jgi:hypothetical protein
LERHESKLILAEEFWCMTPLLDFVKIRSALSEVKHTDKFKCSCIKKSFVICND